MSGFDTRWLDLREPADHAARNQPLARQAADLAVGRAANGLPTIVDLGCGTGSTLRALAPHLTVPAQWILFDNDAGLLAEAKRRAGARQVATVEGDLGQVDAVPLDGAALVTASALFDLVSRSWLEAFVARLASARTPLYAALSFDGQVTWNTRLDEDDVVLETFNANQQTDKGFGAALGPTAGRELAKLLTMDGWRVTTAASDWQLTVTHESLERAFVSGMASAVREQSMLPPATVDRWEAGRLAAVGSGCRVGHLDLLAAPST